MKLLEKRKLNAGQRAQIELENFVVEGAEGAGFPTRTMSTGERQTILQPLQPACQMLGGLERQRAVAVVDGEAYWDGRGAL